MITDNVLWRRVLGLALKAGYFTDNYHSWWVETEALWFDLIADLDVEGLAIDCEKNDKNNYETMILIRPDGTRVVLPDPFDIEERPWNPTPATLDETVRVLKEESVR